MNAITVSLDQFIDNILAAPVDKLKEYWMFDGRMVEVDQTIEVEFTKVGGRSKKTLEFYKWSWNAEKASLHNAYGARWGCAVWDPTRQVLVIEEWSLKQVTTTMSCRTTITWQPDKVKATYETKFPLFETLYKRLQEIKSNI